MRVIDGMHRLRAAQARGAREIDVRFFEGPVEDAFVLAVESNVLHGMPLSTADRIAAAERILTTHPHWSDRSIAEVAGLAAKTVGSVRRRATGVIPQSHTRVGRDGRVRPLDSSRGRQVASELIAKNPDVSLRQIVKAAKISLGTARDVRERLRRGESPIPRRNRSERVQRPPTVRAADEPPNHADVLRQLRSDPSLRLTESGRILLRLLDTYAIESGRWDNISDNVPEHCLDRVAELAAECADVWRNFAEQLNRRRAESA